MSSQQYNAKISLFQTEIIKRVLCFNADGGVYPRVSVSISGELRPDGRECWLIFSRSEGQVTLYVYDDGLHFTTLKDDVRLERDSINTESDFLIAAIYIVEQFLSINV